jgi:hypothetical protein
MALDRAALLNVLMYSQKEVCRIYKEGMRFRIIH